uniref:Uncharacterized protein n=1 Tax=viral metagenome TaxID=1070528 RepID=A0A6C0JR01_9ZZZZ
MAVVYDFNTVNLSSSTIKCGNLLLPTTDGSSGDLITTDGLGNLTLTVPPFVVGPVSATTNDLCLFNNNSGKEITSSTATCTPLGDLTVSSLINGALTYPNTDSTAGYLLSTDGSGVISFIAPSSDVDIQTNQAFSEVISVYSTNVSSGDHIKFNVDGFTNGSLITVDLTTTYTNTANVASLGRISLVTGHSYLLEGSLDLISIKDHVATFTVQWYNSDDNVALGNPFVYLADGEDHPKICNVNLKAYYNNTSGSTKRVELRITNNPSSNLRSITRASTNIKTIT